MPADPPTDRSVRGARARSLGPEGLHSESERAGLQSCRCGFRVLGPVAKWYLWLGLRSLAKSGMSWRGCGGVR